MLLVLYLGSSRQMEKASQDRRERLDQTLRAPNWDEKEPAQGPEEDIAGRGLSPVWWPPSAKTALLKGWKSGGWLQRRKRWSMNYFINIIIREFLTN